MSVQFFILQLASLTHWASMSQLRSISLELAALVPDIACCISIGKNKFSTSQINLASFQRYVLQSNGVLTSDGDPMILLVPKFLSGENSFSRSSIICFVASLRNTILNLPPILLPCKINNMVHLPQFPSKMKRGIFM